MRKVFFILIIVIISQMLYAVAEENQALVVPYLPTTNNYTYQTFTNSGFTFKYRTTYNNELDCILYANTSGWISVGFGGTNTGHNGANIIIGYVQGGVLHIADNYGTSAETHASDVSLGGTDNIIQSSGTESGGVTTINFRIPLNSGDQYDKVLTIGGNMHLILAKGAADNYTSMHNGSGVGNITIPQIQYPSSFTSFSVNPVQGSNPRCELSWVTGNENELMGYKVFRNTVNDFNSAAVLNETIISANNAVGPNSYSYTDTAIQLETSYYYWIQYSTADGYTGVSEVVSAQVLANENDPETLIQGLNLTNYPNPFNPETTISFTLTEKSFVRLEVYNVLGQKVKTLVSQDKDKGEHSVVWNGKDQHGKKAVSGLYYLRLQAGKMSLLRKVMLLK